ncbi:hypothetical protein [Secundilactobacillus mixtipabuli]|uniref:Uncharacterized protein n=1 Tax=Secundilactobacillus mixtipabuli TaxID=1435342 RepID=A0A1Z5ICY4_9LACO|nr:hypothetical protein [Secundilactobacillus mixtipabuli]GAW99584.1 hypothetical protein IWT30_01554 [Secundilactobacillus mixtipabuli]
MKKSLFAKLYHTFVLGLKVDLLLAVTAGFVTFVTSELSNSRAPSLVRLAAAIEPEVNIGWKVTIIISVILTFLLAYEILLHAKRDRVSYLFSSVYKSWLLQRFLHYTETQIRPIIYSAQFTTISRTPAIRSFNRAAQKAVVELNKNTITVFIKLPSSQQAQKIFKEMESDIREEISNRNPDYTISQPIRSKNLMRFDGTKK